MSEGKLMTRCKISCEDFLRSQSSTCCLNYIWWFFCTGCYLFIVRFTSIDFFLLSNWTGDSFLPNYSLEHPVTFAGKSYAKWKLQHSTKKRFSLRFRLRTRQTSATLMYAKGKVDYSILKVRQLRLVSWLIGCLFVCFIFWLVSGLIGLWILRKTQC